MGHTYNNTITHSGSGEQNIAQGDGAIGKQVNISNASQASPEELLQLLAEIKKLLPELPDKEQLKLGNAVEEVEMEVKQDKPDGEDIAATLTRAQKILKAVPGVAAAPPRQLLADDHEVCCIFPVVRSLESARQLLPLLLENSCIQSGMQPETRLITYGIQQWLDSGNDSGLFCLDEAAD